MKVKISWARTDGRPNYSSVRGAIDLEIELPDNLTENPALFCERVNGLYSLAEAAVDRQIEQSRPEPPAVSDLRPGDPAYDRMHAPPPRRPEPMTQREYDQGDDRYPDDRRQQPRNGGGNGYRQQGGGAPPTNGRSFCGWLNRQPPEVHDQVKAIVRGWNLDTYYSNWTDQQVREVYQELQQVPAGRSDWGGNGR